MAAFEPSWFLLEEAAAFDFGHNFRLLDITEKSSQDDLNRHFLAMNARLSGQAFTGTSPNCRVIVNAVGIKILAREGPGRTKVQLTNAGQNTGWTDTFLPARPPGQG